MHSSAERFESRREFLRAAGRGGLLALLAAVSGLAAWSRGSAGRRCARQGVCRGCAVFASCSLPQALSAKDAQAGG